MSRLLELEKKITIYEKRLEANRIAWEEVEKANSLLSKKNKELEKKELEIARYNDIIDTQKGQVNTLTDKLIKQSLNEKAVNDILDKLYKVKTETLSKITKNNKKIEKDEESYEKYKIKIIQSKNKLNLELDSLKEKVSFENNRLIETKNRIETAKTLVENKVKEYENIVVVIANLKKDKQLLEDEIYNLSIKYIEGHKE